MQSLTFYNITTTVFLGALKTNNMKSLDFKEWIIITSVLKIYFCDLHE